MDRNRLLIGYVFAGAMLVAPFLALLYHATAGLGVLAAALAATSYLAFDASAAAEEPRRRRLRLLAGVNGGLAVAAVLFVVARLVN